MPSPKHKQPTTPSTVPNYESEKHLRSFCEITSEEITKVTGALLGELRFANNAKTPEEQQRAVQLAARASEQVLDLSRNLKFFAAHTKLDRYIGEVSQLLLDAVERIEQEAESKALKFAVFVESGVLARTDANALYQVFFNLLRHTVAQSPVGGKITITLRKTDPSIEILIADSGRGYSPEEVEKLFEPYFVREDSASYDPHGLDLAVCRAITDAHGGEIHAQSTLGKGTTFSLRIPSETQVPAPVPYAEKRKHRRVNVTVPVEATFPNHKTFFTFLTTLGSGGCYIRVNPNTREEIPAAGTLLSLKLILREDQTIDIPKARIAYRTLDGLEPGMGIEFLEIAERAYLVLNAIVEGR